MQRESARKEMTRMKVRIDVFGLKKWYKQLLDENFYKFLISLGLLACAPVIASILAYYQRLSDDLAGLWQSVLFFQ